MSVFVEQPTETTERYSDIADLMHGQSSGALADSMGMRGYATALLPRARRAVLLNRVVVAEILPRLALARRTAAAANCAACGPWVTTEVDILELVRLLLAHEAPASIAFVETLQLRGATAELLYVGLLSEAARRLGAMWEDDRCDFTQVTISVGRLQQVARHLAPNFQDAAVRRPDAHSILLLPARGEQHTFGLVILAEFFHRAGWHVAGGPVTAGVDPADTVHDSWFDVVGFSIGSELLLAALVMTIHRVRRASRNRSVGIMAGGPLFRLRPELAARCGADIVATDAPGAVQQANGLPRLRAAAE